MEQSAIIDQLDFRLDVMPQMAALGFSGPSGTKMSVYICPSDGTTAGLLGNAEQFYNYAKSMGNQNMPGQFGCNLYPNNSYQTRFTTGVLGGNLFGKGGAGPRQ